MLTKNNIEGLKEVITKDDLKRLAEKDEEVLIFDFLKDITDQIIGGAKEMFGFKKGGVVCRGQGMAKNKKITKMY